MVVFGIGPILIFSGYDRNHRYYVGWPKQQRSSDYVMMFDIDGGLIPEHR